MACVCFPPRLAKEITWVALLTVVGLADGLSDDVGANQTALNASDANMGKGPSVWGVDPTSVIVVVLQKGQQGKIQPLLAGLRQPILGIASRSCILERFLGQDVGTEVSGSKVQSTFGTVGFHGGQPYQVSNDEVFSHLLWQVHSCERLWWRVAYEELFHQWIYVRFVLFGPFLLVIE